MDVREKLVELIANAKAMYADDYTDHTEDEYIAETLLDNFITVWDGKPIEAFLHPIDAYKGLKAKYLVFKADTGEMVDNCFILRPDKDAVAVEALRAYAKVTDNETLAKDIYNWVGNGVTVQELALPEEEYYVLRNTETGMYFRGKGVNRWGKHFNQATIYRVKGTAEHSIKEVAWHGEKAKLVRIKIVEMPQPPKGE